jgi:hypothetical protein
VVPGSHTTENKKGGGAPGKKKMGATPGVKKPRLNDTDDPDDPKPPPINGPPPRFN